MSANFTLPPLNLFKTLPKETTVDAQNSKIVRGAAALAFLFALTFATTCPAQTESVLYNFCSLTFCHDGQNPYGTPVMDSQGNFYGTTFFGGANGCGAVFKVSPDGTETVLYSFLAGTLDGNDPAAGVIIDKQGNLYGTTFSGGTFGYGGTVFRLAPDGTETILHSFGGTSDGNRPQAALIRDGRGNLYGTTVAGGAYGNGTVFEITAIGTESILHSFAQNTSDGGFPQSSLIIDSRGNLYGTTVYGGAYGYGTVFRISPGGTETVLHNFGNKSDGQTPYGSLVMDDSGVLYGTTSGGGALRAGTVFKLSPNGAEWVLHSFDPKLGDGEFPIAGLLLDANGNLYGTTTFGGSLGAGTVFEITADGTETILHNFAGSTADGATPYSNVSADSNGNLYGTTYNGGSTFASGTLYKITP
jgi:uncharacterized repeat protein (TIGR03803 family)